MNPKQIEQDRKEILESLRYECMTLEECREEVIHIFYQQPDDIFKGREITMVTTVAFITLKFMRFIIYFQPKKNRRKQLWIIEVGFNDPNNLKPKCWKDNKPGEGPTPFKLPKQFLGRLQELAQKTSVAQMSPK